MYHLSIKIITRSAGRSAVAAAAYRAGDIIKNERDGLLHDYTRKSDVMHTEILLPDNAPPEYKNRALLWNAVEQIEKLTVMPTFSVCVSPHRNCHIPSSKSCDTYRIGLPSCRTQKQVRTATFGFSSKGKLSNINTSLLVYLIAFVAIVITTIVAIAPITL